MSIFKGFIIGAGMIIPIGAQNSYILNQAIKKNFHFTAASVCIICDLFLMTLGVYGGGALINSNNFLYSLITWGGIAFLTVYGGLFFKSFIFAKHETTEKVKLFKSRKTVVFTTLAVTLLNPHVYLDTVVIIGSISGGFEASEKFAFLTGTIIASLVWFYSLSFAAEKLSPWLSKTIVQRFINLFVALIMWGIALSLFMSQ